MRRCTRRRGTVLRRWSSAALPQRRQCAWSALRTRCAPSRSPPSASYSSGMEHALSSYCEALTPAFARMILFQRGSHTLRRRRSADMAYRGRAGGGSSSGARRGRCGGASRRHLALRGVSTGSSARRSQRTVARRALCRPRTPRRGRTVRRGRHGRPPCRSGAAAGAAATKRTARH